MGHATRVTLIALAAAAALVAGVAAALAATASGPGPAAPERDDGAQARLGNVSCGQTLTESTIVANDLSNCAGDGLVVGADGITVDLNGHTIDSQTLANGSGVLVSGVDGAVVKNGVITGFEVGVSIAFGADQTRVQGLRISDFRLGNGIEADAGRTVVTGNTVFGRAIGIRASSQETAVADNTVKDNDIGILAGGSRSIVVRNTALSNATHGIQVVAGGTSVADNIANANGEHGIDVLSGTDSRVRGNAASFNSDLGIDAEASVIDEGGNTASGNGSLHQCENVVCTGR